MPKLRSIRRRRKNLHWKVPIPQMKGKIGQATLERDSFFTQATRHWQGQCKISRQEERKLGPWIQDLTTDQKEIPHGGIYRENSDRWNSHRSDKLEPRSRFIWRLFQKRAAKEQMGVWQATKCMIWIVDQLNKLVTTFNASLSASK